MDKKRKAYSTPIKKQWKKSKSAPPVDKMKIAKSINLGGTYFFKRSYYGGSLSSNTLTPSTVEIAVALSNVGDVSDFANLFDQFKIDYCKIHFVPKGTGSDMNPNATFVGQPTIVTSIDIDGGGTPTTMAGMLQRGNAKIQSACTEFKVGFIPKFQKEIYRTAIATAYGPGSGWIDINYNNCPHYGLQAMIDVAGVTYSYEYYVTLYFSCKHTR